MEFCISFIIYQTLILTHMLCQDNNKKMLVLCDSSGLCRKMCILTNEYNTCCIEFWVFKNAIFWPKIFSNIWNLLLFFLNWVSAMLWQVAKIWIVKITHLPEGYLFNYVHRDFIHKSKKLEITYMSLNQRKDKGNIAYLHTGLLFSCLKKKWLHESCRQMDGSWKKSLWVGNPDTERQMWYAFIYK